MYKASRFGARVLLLMAAAATVMAAEQPVPLEAATWASVKLVHFIFGAIGAAVMVTTKPLGWWETFATVFAGVVCSSLGTPLVLEHLGKASPAWENALACVLGAIGLYIVIGLKKFGNAFADNPLSIVDWWRGRGKPSPPPADAGDEATQGGKQ